MNGFEESAPSALERIKRGDENFLHEFERDPVKAHSNFNKHGLDFARAATVFLDPLAVTVPDEEHSESEVRWITLGRGRTGHYVLVVHTFESLAED